MSVAMRSHAISTVKLPVDDQVVMRVILAAKSSLLTNVHGSVVVAANPVQGFTTPKKKIKKYARN